MKNNNKKIRNKYLFFNFLFLIITILIFPSYSGLFVIAFMVISHIIIKEYK